MGEERCHTRLGGERGQRRLSSIVEALLKRRTDDINTRTHIHTHFHTHGGRARARERERERESERARERERARARERTCMHACAHTDIAHQATLTHAHTNARTTSHSTPERAGLRLHVCRGTLHRFVHKLCQTTERQMVNRLCFLYTELINNLHVSRVSHGRVLCVSNSNISVATK